MTAIANVDIERDTKIAVLQEQINVAHSARREAADAYNEMGRKFVKVMLIVLAISSLVIVVMTIVSPFADRWVSLGAGVLMGGIMMIIYNVVAAVNVEPLENEVRIHEDKIYKLRKNLIEAWEGATINHMKYSFINLSDYDDASEKILFENDDEVYPKYVKIVKKDGKEVVIIKEAIGE